MINGIKKLVNKHFLFSTFLDPGKNDNELIRVVNLKELVQYLSN